MVGVLRSYPGHDSEEFSQSDYDLKVSHWTKIDWSSAKKPNLSLLCQICVNKSQTYTVASAPAVTGSVFYAETLIQCIEENLTYSCSNSRRTDRVCAPRVSERPEEVTRTTRRRTTFVATLLSTQPLWPPSSSIARRRSLLASLRSTLGSPRSIRVSLRRTHDSRPRKIRDSRPRIRDSPPSDRILAKQRGQQR